MGLVILGHLIEPLALGPRSVAWIAGLYRLIYLFHIPLFAWVSGYFSRPAPLEAREWLKGAGQAMARLLLPYLMFQALYQAFDAWLFHHPFALRISQPYWLLWFLPSLLCWRLLLGPAVHLAKRIGDAWVLGLALLLALAAFSVPGIGYPFSLARTLHFFPAYLFGWFAAQKGWRPCRRPWLMVLAASVLIPVVALQAPDSLLSGMDARWLYGSYGRAALGAGWLQAMTAQGISLVAALGLGYVYLAGMPSGRSRLSPLGAHTLYAYLLHGFLIRCFWAWVPGFGTAHPALLIPLALSLTLALCSSFMARSFRWLVEPVRI